MDKTWKDLPEGGKFVNFENGPFIGYFVQGELVTTKYGESVRLHFKTEDGHSKQFDTRSRRLINIMRKITEGSLVQISRYGQSTETRYDVSVVKNSGKEKLENLSDNFNLWNEDGGRGDNG